MRNARPPATPLSRAPHADSTDRQILSSSVRHVSKPCPENYNHNPSSFSSPPSAYPHGHLQRPRVTHPARPPLYKTHPHPTLTPNSQTQAMESGDCTRNTVKFVTAAGIGSSLLVLSGLLLTGTVIALVMATPVLVIFSPVLVPAGAAVMLAMMGLVVSGGFGVAAVSALAWIYNYVAGKNPVGAEQLDSARMRLAQAARDVKEKAKDYGHYVQNKAHEATS